MATRVLVIGSSGHAGVAIDAIERCGLEVAGLVDSFRQAGESAYGYQVIGPEDAIPAFLQKYEDCAVAIAIGDNFQRRRMRHRLRELAPQLGAVTVIHPHASVSARASIEDGAMVCAGAIVCAGARVGEGCLLNTGATLDHDCTMEAYSSLGPGAVVGGSVRIGECSAVGIGATLRHGVSIGAHTVIGAGAVVVGDIPARCVAYGVPARAVRERRADEPYL
ncbi:MAG: acetyltransferase [Burkholderiales bacterium]